MRHNQVLTGHPLHIIAELSYNQAVQKHENPGKKAGQGGSRPPQKPDIPRLAAPVFRQRPPNLRLNRVKFGGNYEYSGF
jgi:hypothetical protein